MIEPGQGDVLAADVEALVNTVNCVGIMGRGVALQFRRAFPDNFIAYKAACGRGEVRPGSMFVFGTGRLANPRWIVNFPTKRHWRDRSSLADIRSGLAGLVAEIRARDIRSVAIPPLGCGLGGLDWNAVRPLIEAALREVPAVRTVLFEPGAAPVARAMVRTGGVPAMTAGRAALIGLMSRYLAGLMTPFVTLIEVQKLMFFMQEAGEPLRLDYRKAPYGPYAGTLRHVLNDIEGHFVSGYADGGDSPDKPLELLPGALADAERFLDAHPDTRARFERVVALVDGFESPFGMELLATVHWVCRREGAATLEQVVDRTHGWNPRKRQFKPEQIAVAYRTLAEQGWLEEPVP